MILSKLDNEKVILPELAAIALGPLPHYPQGQVGNCLYQQLQHKKAVGMGSLSDPYKTISSGKTN